MRVLYISPMACELNPAMDAIAYGLQHSLHTAGIQMRMLIADFREAASESWTESSAGGWAARTASAIQAGIDARVDAIAFYAFQPTEPAAAVAQARSAGIPVFTFIRPSFPVNAALLYPNFNHGVCMAEWLADRLAANARVGILGGPDTSDDAEQVAGLLYAFRRRRVTLVNDPTDPAWCNLTDAPPGGEAVALRLLKACPELDALVAYNDPTMLGVLAAFEQIGRPNGLTLISRNGSPQAVAEIRAGRCQGTWDLDASGIGTALGELIVRQLTGEPLRDGHLGIGPVGRMIDAENVDTWQPWTARVTVKPFTLGLDGPGA